MCFASTQCKVYHPNDTWSLAPFCGKSTCRAMKNRKKIVIIKPKIWYKLYIFS